MRIAPARIVAVLLGVAFASQWMAAQSLGESARRERERRAALPAHARVLTNEDLSREKILQSPVEEPPAPFRAAGPALPITAHPSLPPEPVADQPGVSLGEYARALLQRKHASATVQAAGPNPPAAPEPVQTQSPATSALAVESVNPVAETPASSPPDISLGEYARRLREEQARQRRALAVAGAQPEDSLITLVRRTPVARLATKRKQEPPGLSAESPRTLETDAGPGVVRVKRGDSLWRIARERFGAGRLWTAIWKTNSQLRNPNLIHSGQVLRLPSAPELAAARVHMTVSKLGVSGPASHLQAPAVLHSPAARAASSDRLLPQ